MIEPVSLSHHIQKHIIDVLMYVDVARFRDLRPPKTDTNLFTYHLNSLVKAGMVIKIEGGYALSIGGLSYVDRVSTEKRAIRTQPKIISMLLIQNSDGEILLQRRSKQPYINAWTLPYGKVHIDDALVMIAAKREATEKLGLTDQKMKHVGDCYIRVKMEDSILSTTLAHVFRFNRDDIEISEDIAWVRPHKLHTFKLAPAVEAIVARGFFNDPFFFEEFDTEWLL